MPATLASRLYGGVTGELCGVGGTTWTSGSSSESADVGGVEWALDVEKSELGEFDLGVLDVEEVEPFGIVMCRSDLTIKKVS